MGVTDSKRRSLKTVNKGFIGPTSVRLPKGRRAEKQIYSCNCLVMYIM
jgi:hypothetical protein